MAIDFTDVASITDTLKYVYGDGIVNQFDQEPLTYHQFPKSSRRPGGLGYQFSIRYERAQGTGARKESAKLPDPLVGKFDKGLIQPKYNYGSIRLTGPAIELGKGNEAAFVEAMADSMDDIYKSVVMELQRQCHADGFGLCATITASDSTSTSGTWTSTCNNKTGLLYLKEGGLYDVFLANGSAILTTANPVACRISSINRVTKVITWEANASLYKGNHPDATLAALTPANSSAVAAGALIIKMGSREASWVVTDTPIDMVGLNGLFDDGTLLTTFEDISTTTYPKWKANKLGNSSVDRELSLDLMLQACDLVRFDAGPNKIQMRMGLGQRRKYAALLMPDVRFAPTVLKGGYETLTFSAGDGSVEMIIDPMTQPGKIFCHPEGAIQKYELTPLGWGNPGEKMTQRAGYDEYDMFLRIYTNLGTEQRNALTYIEDLIEPNLWS